MTAQVQPMRDRRGEVYTPAVGPRLRPLALDHPHQLRPAGSQWLLPRQRHRADLVPGHDAADVLLHVDGRSAPAAGLPADRAVPGLRVRAPVDVLEAAQSGCGALWAGALASASDPPRIGRRPGPDRGFEVRDPGVREVGYWLHVLTPLAAIGLYVKHRLAGPMIRWHWARRFGVAVVGFVVLMGLLHREDPARSASRGPRRARSTSIPSEAITANGKFIPAKTLMMDDYCLKCHKDAYEGWFHSSHHFSSFNNKAYLSSVRETRKVSMERDGTTQAARWCAGCHDPVPFFSGEFDDPNYDDVNNPTSQAGITCTVVPLDHERQQHPRQRRLHDRGARALSLRLQRQPGLAVDQQHAGQGQARDAQEDVPQAGDQGRRSSARPATRSALPYALNHYKDFVRGQNHYDPFLLSGVSGHGARSFYYPAGRQDERASSVTWS